MQFKIKLPWLFTKNRTDTGSQPPLKPIQKASPSYSIFRSITELPLSRWIDLTVSGDINAVIKEGCPPERELQLAIAELRQQYADAAGDNHYKMYCNLIKEISNLEITLLEVGQLVETLRDAYHPLLAKALNGVLGTSFVFDVTKPAEYDKNLDRCIRRTGGLKISLGLKTAALKAMEEKYTKDGVKPTREYYSSILITLRQDSGYHVLPENISTWEFCEMIRRFNIKAAKK